VNSALFQLTNGFDQLFRGKPAIAEHVIRDKAMLHRPFDQGNGIGDLINEQFLGSFITSSIFAALFSIINCGIYGFT